MSSDIPWFTEANRRGETPLHLAAKGGREEAVSIILRKLETSNLTDYKNAQDWQGKTPLHHASENNMARVVELLLEAGVAVENEDVSGRVPLHLASAKGFDAVVDLLLKAYASPVAKDSDDRLPLHLASMKGHHRVASLLLQRVNASETPNASDRHGQPPLFYAVDGHHRAVAELLKGAGAVVNTRKGQRTLLSQMAQKGNAEACAILADLGADKEAVDRNGRTPLYAAAEAGHREAFMTLISKHANKNAVDRRSYKTLLHLAAQDNRITAAELLLEVKATTEGKDNKGRTPLYVAAKAGHFDMARLLVGSGADKESPDANRGTWLHRAARENDSNAANVLCRIGASIEARDDLSRTPLYTAAELDHKEVAKALIDRGAHVDADDGSGTGATLLHRAAREGNAHAVSILNGGEIDPNAQDLEGRTPLHVAATHALEVVRILLSAEAHQDIRDNNGQTPLHVAASKGDQAAEMVKLLIKEEVTPAPMMNRDNNGQTPLHAAAQRGELDVLILLLENTTVREQLNATDKSGQTALHVAAAHGMQDAVELLINEGLDKEAEDNQRRTPLHIAASHGRTRVVRTLLAKGADRAAKDELGQYPFHLTALGGHTEAMELLVDTRPINLAMPETVQQYIVFVRKFIKDNMGGIFNPSDPLVKDLARKAVERLPDITQKWNLPQTDGPGLVKLTLFDFVILCDDSSSMHHGDGTRIKHLTRTLERVANIAMSMDLDGSGINVRFLNYPDDSSGDFDHMNDTEKILGRVENVFRVSRGDSRLGGKLESKVVEPFIYRKIKAKNLKRPVIVLLITDGEPFNEHKDTLKETIQSCRQFLKDNDYGTGSVIFLLCQVGDSQDAKEFLEGIQNDKEIENMVFCSRDRLDDMLEVISDQWGEHGFTVKLIQLFLAALGAQSV